VYNLFIVTKTKTKIHIMSSYIPHENHKKSWFTKTRLFLLAIAILTVTVIGVIAGVSSGLIAGKNKSNAAQAGIVDNLVPDDGTDDNGNAIIQGGDGFDWTVKPDGSDYGCKADNSCPPATVLGRPNGITNSEGKIIPIIGCTGTREECTPKTTPTGSSINSGSNGGYIEGAPTAPAAGASKYGTFPTNTEWLWATRNDGTIDAFTCNGYLGWAGAQNSNSFVPLSVKMKTYSADEGERTFPVTDTRTNPSGTKNFWFVGVYPEALKDGKEREIYFVGNQRGDDKEVLLRRGDGTPDGSTNAFVQKFACKNEAPATDNAQFISQTCTDTTMAAFSKVNCEIVIKNTGTAVWPVGGEWKLGTQNPQDNTDLGFGRIVTNKVVNPGESVTYTVNLQPVKTGTFNLQMQMVHEAVAWFGEKSPNKVITVTPAQVKPPIVDASKFTLSCTKGADKSDIIKVEFPALDYKYHVRATLAGKENDTTQEYRLFWNNDVITSPIEIVIPNKSWVVANGNYSVWIHTSTSAVEGVNESEAVQKQVVCDATIAAINFCGGPAVTDKKYDVATGTCKPVITNQCATNADCASGLECKPSKVCGIIEPTVITKESCETGNSTKYFVPATNECKSITTEEVQLTVGSKKIRCPTRFAAPANFVPEINCLDIKENNVSLPNGSYTNSSGFAYEEGYNYVIKSTKFQNVGLLSTPKLVVADGYNPDFYYNYISTVSKTAVVVSSSSVSSTVVSSQPSSTITTSSQSNSIIAESSKSSVLPAPKTDIVRTGGNEINVPVVVAISIVILSAAFAIWKMYFRKPKLSL
jgi:hypothetical protein